MRAEDVRAAYRLVGECRELGDDAAVWRAHWLAGLARLVDADLGVSGELGGLKAGHPRDLGTTDWGWHNGFDRAAWLQALTHLEANPLYSPILLGYADRFRAEEGVAAPITELLDERVLVRSIDYQLYRAMGAFHTLWCFRPVPGAADEAGGGFLCRAAGRPNYTPREVAVAREAHALLGPLVGGPLARFTEPSPTALPPRARAVLRCLLEGDSDKQVAARLGIGRYTVNQYVKVIYRHFGVTSRPELLARWVRRGWGGRFAWAE